MNDAGQTDGLANPTASPARRRGKVYMAGEKPSIVLMNSNLVTEGETKGMVFLQGMVRPDLGCKRGSALTMIDSITFD